MFVQPALDQNLSNKIWQAFLFGAIVTNCYLLPAGIPGISIFL